MLNYFIIKIIFLLFIKTWPYTVYFRHVNLSHFCFLFFVSILLFNINSMIEILSLIYIWL